MSKDIYCGLLKTRDNAIALHEEQTETALHALPENQTHGVANIMLILIDNFSYHGRFYINDAKSFFLDSFWFLFAVFIVDKKGQKTK